MTATGRERSVRDGLVRLHPLVRLALRNAPALAGPVADAVAEEVMASARRLLEGEPDLSADAVALAVHSRLRCLIAKPPQAAAGGGGEVSGPPKDVEAVTRARSDAVKGVLYGSTGPQREALRLRLKEGMADREIAKKLGAGIDDVHRISTEASLRMERAWLKAEPGGPAFEDLPPCPQPNWSPHFLDYARGRLDPDRKNRVEEHAFLCARCGVRLASLQAAHDFVRTGNGLAGPVAAKEDGTKRGKTPGVVVWIVAALASAAATAILLLGTLDRDEMQASAKRLSALDPPEIPASTSLPSDSPHLETFRRAVAAYERGSYSEAAREWERLYEAEASVRDLGLYLGVSQLIEGRAEEAAATLARSLPEGEAATPYHFYRAQALLVAGHVEEAREELRVVLSAGESIYREDAARQLTSLLGPPEEF